MHEFWDSRQDQFTLEEPEEIPGQKSERPAPVLPAHSDVVQLYHDPDGEHKAEESSCCGLEFNREAMRPSPPPADNSNAANSTESTTTTTTTTDAPPEETKENGQEPTEGRQPNRYY